jgi:F0F1-type ATP synthase assembly protein I
MVNEGKEKVWNAYSLALTLGYMVALPVVILGVGGVLLDKHFNSFPLFVIIGFILAMTVSLTTVYVKTKDIISMGTLKTKSRKDNKD